MPIDRLKRIMWRLQEEGRIKDGNIVLKDLRRSIIMEAGYSEDCIKNTISALQEIGVIKRINRYVWKQIKDFTVL